MDSAREVSTRWAVLTGVSGALLALLAARLRAVPVAEWGSNGSAWAEHRGRLSWLLSLRQNAGVDDPLGPAELLRSLESGFPAGLYLFGVALEPLAGPAAEAVAWAGLLWLIPLAWGVGAVAAWLGGRRSLLPVGALAVLLVPAIPASALRYYFDLPMTALIWASAGVLVGGRWGGGGALAGLLAGLLGGLACLVKWTALPFVLPIWLGLALARPAEGRRVSWGAVIAAGGGLVLVVGAYLLAVGGENSLLAMAEEARVGPKSGGLGGLIVSSLIGLASPQPELGARLLFYAGTTVAGVLSPLGATLALGGLVAWWRQGRLGWPLLAVVIGGHAAVLLLLVRPADERFVLTGIPVLVVAAVLAWQGLAPRVRARVGVFVVSALLLVAADAHLGWPPLGAPAADIKAIDGGGPIASQTLRLRGLGMASSFQGRGWYRRDEVPPVRAGLRRATWAWLVACSPEIVRAAVDGPTIHEEGDQQWFGYRSALAAWRGEPGGLAFRGLGCEGPVGRARTVWLTRAIESGNQLPPPCPEDADWTMLDVIEDPGGGPGVAAWSGVGAARCEDLGGGPTR